MGVLRGCLLAMVVTWGLVVAALSMSMFDVIEKNRATEREIAEQYRNMRSEIERRTNGMRPIRPSLQVSIVVRRER